MKVYINYPGSRITMHRDADCRAVRKHHKKDQRIVSVTPQTVEKVLSDFTGNMTYNFSASKALNDLWLDIALRTPEEEESFVHTIKALLSRHYTPFEHVVIHEHCSG